MARRKHTTDPTQLDLSFGPTEEWRDVPGYEGLYQVSSLGRIMNSRPKRHHPMLSERIMSPHPDHWGYLKIHLSNAGKTKVLSVHSLVLIAFVGARPDGYVCNHLDGNRSNNRLENLEWCTQKANIHHAMQRGTHPKGERVASSKLTEADVIEIRRLADEGATQLALARQFRMSQGTMWGIIHRVRWKHIP